MMNSKYCTLAYECLLPRPEVLDLVEGRTKRLTGQTVAGLPATGYAQAHDLHDIFLIDYRTIVRIL